MASGVLFLKGRAGQTSTINEGVDMKKLGKDLKMNEMVIIDEIQARVIFSCDSVWSKASKKNGLIAGGDGKINEEISLNKEYEVAGVLEYKNKRVNLFTESGKFVCNTLMPVFNENPTRY
jgi:hypothetical protein